MRLLIPLERDTRRCLPALLHEDVAGALLRPPLHLSATAISAGSSAAKSEATSMTAII